MSSLVRFEVCGLNQLKLLNTLLQRGVKFENIKKESQKLIYFSVDDRDKSVTTKILEELCFSYKIVKETNPIKTFKRIIPRLGLAIGLIVMTVLSVYLSSFLWKIEITGNNRIDELSIIRTLKLNNVAVGNKKNFDIDLVEASLRELDEISAVSAELIGTTLKIEVIESAETSPPKQIGDIVSLYDSEVTRIVVNEGTAKVKIGDRIPVGSMLIEGAEYNTAGEFLRKVDAQGSIYGKVNFTYSEIVSLLDGYKRTGNVRTNTIINFFGLKIGREIDILNEFEYNESETTVSQIGNLFPIIAITTKYYELEKLPDKELSVLEEDIKRKAINDLVICAGGSEIKTTVNSLIMSDKIYRITVHIEAEVSIGGKSID